MWQFMHCDDGIARVNLCAMGWPRSFFKIAWSPLKLRPWLPYLLYQPECVGERSFA